MGYCRTVAGYSVASVGALFALYALIIELTGNNNGLLGIIVGLIVGFIGLCLVPTRSNWSPPDPNDDGRDG